MYRRSLEHDEGPLTSSSDRQVVRDILNSGGSHTAKELSKALNVSKQSSAGIRVRRIALDLTLYDGFPVVANREGYRLARSAEEVEEYVDWLEATRESIEFRINAIRYSWSHFKPRARRTRKLKSRRGRK